jgi:hypothetical protein
VARSWRPWFAGGRCPARRPAPRHAGEPATTRSCRTPSPTSLTIARGGRGTAGWLGVTVSQNPRRGSAVAKSLRCATWRFHWCAPAVLQDRTLEVRGSIPLGSTAARTRARIATVRALVVWGRVAPGDAEIPRGPVHARRARPCDRPDHRDRRRHRQRRRARWRPTRRSRGTGEPHSRSPDPWAESVAPEAGPVDVSRSARSHGIGRVQHNRAIERVTDAHGVRSMLPRAHGERARHVHSCSPGWRTGCRAFRPDACAPPCDRPSRR